MALLVVRGVRALVVAATVQFEDKRGLFAADQGSLVPMVLPAAHSISLSRRYCCARDTHVNQDIDRREATNMELHHDPHLHERDALSGT